MVALTVVGETGEMESDEAPEYRVRFDPDRSTWVASCVTHPHGAGTGIDPIAALADLIAFAPASSLMFLTDTPVPATMEAVLAGEAAYEDLQTENERDQVRVEWDRRLTERVESVDLGEVLTAEGRRWWVVTDEDGVVAYQVVQQDGSLVSLTSEQWEAKKSELGL